MGSPAGTAATSPPASTLQAFRPHENLPEISVNPWSSGGGFITEKGSDVISFTRKRKCHKKAPELLRLPPAARNMPGVPGHGKHQEGHWFCLWLCSDRSIWRMLKPLDQAPVRAHCSQFISLCEFTSSYRNICTG